MTTGVQHQRLILALLIIMAMTLGMLIAKPGLLIHSPNAAQAQGFTVDSQSTSGGGVQPTIDPNSVAAGTMHTKSAVKKPSPSGGSSGAASGSNQLAANRVRTPARKRSLLVRIPRDMQARSAPGAGAVVGTVPAYSKYMHKPVTAWVIRTSPDGKYGEVALPFTNGHKKGWIALAGLKRSSTRYVIRAKLGAHDLFVERDGIPIMRFHAGTGKLNSPTPPGLYFVTERIANPGGSFGSFIFGMSGLQPHPPPGWTGPAQLAIHGTNQPSSVGKSSSAGCLRMSKQALDKLRPILVEGTPVIFER